MTNGHYIYLVKRKINREDILKAGIELMHLNGYGSTGIKDITDRVKIPKGSFYNHFKSKEEFGIEVLGYYMEQVAVNVRNKLEDKKINPLKRLKQVLQDNIDEQNNKTYCKLGSLVGNFTQELGDVSEVFNEAVSSAFAKMKLNYKNCIQEAIDNKDISPDYTSSQLADFIVDGWEGASLRMKADKNTKAMELFIKVFFDKVLK